MSGWQRAVWAVLGSAVLACAPGVLVGCGSNDGANDPSGPNAPPLEQPADPGAGGGKPAEDPVKKELPWEVVSDQGETYLSNVFYAEATENEQIMPTAIDGHYQIDRMVYPTIGNPNLYVKGDPKDSFMMVLRLEDEAVAHLAPETHAIAGSALEQVDFKETLDDTFAILLIPRTSRQNATESTAPLPSGQGTEVLRIKPSKVVSRPNDQDMPAQFQKRRTYRFVFDQAAMKDVPAELTFDRVLVSVGRRPNSANLGLDKAGVKANDRGYIPIDRQRRTNVPHIYAIGDVGEEPGLAHKATAEARVAVEAILGEPAEWSPRAIPAVIFTDPEIAWAGLTEKDAQAQNVPHEVLKFPWAASGRAVSIARTEGLTKMLVDPESKRVLGAGIVGAGAGEMIAESVLAIEMGAVARDVLESIHPHPTLSETVMESAELAYGAATHMARPKARK